MIIVTGGAGFIGSNLVARLNQMGRSDILVVDNLTNGRKCLNLADSSLYSYQDKRDFLQEIEQHGLPAQTEVVFHLGACSSTTEWDGHYMLDNNFRYSRTLLNACQRQQVPLLYASSASVYGSGPNFREQPDCECPLNVYAWSKLLFDQHVRQRQTDFSAQVVGFRFFNVYGPREQHKGGMASIAWHMNRQLDEGNVCRLFEGSHGYAAGAQLRDFIHVADAVAVMLWFWKKPEHSGIFNLGTGKAQSFNEVAQAVCDWHQRGTIDYIPFPEGLADSYQSYTQADISALRAVGCEHNFMDVASGVHHYMERLHAS